MATEKEVEKKRDRVESLRGKLAEINASPDTSDDNEIQMTLLDREEKEIQAQIDEALATKKLRHKDASDPIAFAQSLLKRDEEVVAERDQKVADAAVVPATTTERKEN